MQHILILNRWNDEFSDYTRYIDHKAYTVSYIVTPYGKACVPENYSGCVIEVKSMENREIVVAAVKKVIDTVGPVDHLLALSEFDLLIAADARKTFGIPGPSLQEVYSWRDKVIMKQTVAQAGIKVPLWLDHLNLETLALFCSQVNFPVILKPRKGEASKGVYKVYSSQELEEACTQIDLSQYECEEFIDAPIGHADGIVAGGELIFFQASQYINNCLDFSQGKFLGSFVLADSKQCSHIEKFTQKVLKALAIKNSAFHLEFFISDSGEPIFLEIGARVGGGEIPFILREIYGVDLYHYWIQAILGKKLFPLAKKTEKTSGFLMIPEPPSTPVVVQRTSSLKKIVPQIYHEILPMEGHILDGKGGYEHIAGRFRFIGNNPQEIQQAIGQAAKLFRVSYTPVQKQVA